VVDAGFGRAWGRCGRWRADYRRVNRFSLPWKPLETVGQNIAAETLLLHLAILMGITAYDKTRHASGKVSALHCAPGGLLVFGDDAT